MAEGNYAQIEKELLAVKFSCEYFHQYVYSHTVLINTDHKPLVHIMSKPLNQAPPRLQGMFLALQKYDIKLQYKPGKLLFAADMLSRASYPMPICVGENDLK